MVASAAISRKIIRIAAQSTTDSRATPKFGTIRDELGAAFRFASDTQWKYRSLYGKEMPDSPTQLIAEAQALRLDPFTHAAKKYGFSEQEAKLKADEEKKREEAFRKDEREKVTKELTEKLGSNPMLRQAESSRFSELSKAVKAGTRPDTMTMTPEQRRQVTREAIHKEIAANETVQ